MRKYFVLGLAIATAGTVFAAVAFAAVDVNHSTTRGTFAPSTIPAGTFKAGALTVEDTTVYCPSGPPCNAEGGTPQVPTTLPDPTSHVDQFIDNSFVITANAGLPKCDPATIAGTDTATAESLCGPGSGNNAELSLTTSGTPNPGTGTVCISDGVPGHPCGATPGVVISAFNGLTQNGNKTIVLHSRVGAPASTTTVLVGELKPCGTCPAGFAYDLDVPVPALAGGAAAITDFKVTVRRKFTNNGHTYNYIKATCDASPWKSQADFIYNSTATETAKRNQPCTAS
jgi:hypothetical protein